MSKNNKKNRKRKNDERESEIYRVNSLNDFIVEDESFDPTKTTNRKNEYFEVDSEPLQEELSFILSKKFNIEKDEIIPLINDVFSKNEYMLEDYLGTKPSTSNWKIGVNEKTVKKIEPELLAIRKEMEDDVPSILKIMNSNITKNEKKQCLRFFDQMNNVDPYSEDYFKFMDQINEILKKGEFYSKTEIKFLESEEEKLKNMYVSIDTLKTKILKLEADSEIKSKLLSQYDQMMSYPSDSTTHTSLREEIEWSIKLPYQKREIDPYVSLNNFELNEFYCEIRKQLDKELYGMDKVKNRIIHILNDRRTSGDECGRSICLIGKPGTGKTSIGKALGKIMNKKFAKISAATLDSSAIKGSNKVYVGSEPSIVLQILANLKTNNPVIMIDEVDKVDMKCQHALLHLSDSSDNKEFQDNYLKNNVHDLSKIMIIYNANGIENLHPAFLDRLDIIYVDDYNNQEKIEIFQNYMLPKALEKIGMKKTDVVISNNAVKKWFENKEDMSLRTVEKTIKEIVGKVNLYRNAVLPNGSLGDLNVGYVIPNFKIPLKIDYKLLLELI